MNMLTWVFFCAEGDTDGARLLRSSSLPLAQTRTGFMDKETGASLEEIIKKNGWWTRSNWAFLYEPPALDRPSNTYHSFISLISPAQKQTLGLPLKFCILESFEVIVICFLCSVICTGVCLHFVISAFIY
ncbi:hypothetical protein Tsubulata_009426 [Turnera subulata]|uniref:Uncharacterized protein n=1 Tax=Turnera subulata TaxID=218843 RepID=A0A9Q0G4K2_9ROSI|nr:hypothetical protein Tsubulata_009426 [Turnera subulata]